MRRGSRADKEVLYESADGPVQGVVGVGFVTFETANDVTRGMTWCIDIGLN